MFTSIPTVHIEDDYPWKYDDYDDDVMFNEFCNRIQFMSLTFDQSENMLRYYFILFIYGACMFCLCGCMPSNPRIAVIGSGIGGTSCAYYLRDLFGLDATIDMYEAKNIGGRMATVNIEGREYESGGSIIHPANVYMVNFTNMLGLKARDSLSGGLGLFDGNEMVFDGSSYSTIMAAQLLWRYGWDIVRVDKFVRSLMYDFNRIYDHQNDGYAFTTVENMMSSMAPNFVELMHTSVKETLTQEGFSELFIEELVRGAMRTNYGQDEFVNGFVGSVSMAGVQPGLWSVHGGNKRIPEELVLRSKVKLIRSKVKAVILTSDAPNAQYKVVSESVLEEVTEKDYDIVVIATPVNDFMSDISFEGFPTNLPSVPQHFHTTVATFLKGVPNIETFGLSNANDFPTAMFTTKDLFFSSIGRHQPVDFKEGDEYNSVYKVFSNAALEKNELGALFTSYQKMAEVTWRAYPEYSAGERDVPPFELYDGMYYVNGIEVAASSMEIDAIGGRNVALLAYNRWMKYAEKVDSMDVLNNENGNVEL